ncbi:MAG TPA: hypothetical protein VG838_06035 [Opitutaceae bacterium]|nr:hypothetical protein [Opitutaceae bacterium]
MDASLDLTRWREAPKGLGYRRWTILYTGLRQLLRVRFFPALIVGAWIAGLLVAGAGFLFTQAVSSGGWLEENAGHFGPRFESLVTAFSGLTTLYPDVCIGGLFTLIFWVHSYVGLGLSLIALTILIPQLIARDRGSHALVIYLSRPLTSTDYLLGKLGVIAGVLVLMWTGPLLFGWLVSMLLAPNRDFIIYGFTPLLHALLYNGIALVVLGAITLGVSALTRSGRVTVAVWIAVWLLLGSIAKIKEAPPWLTRASFSHDLSEVRQEVFAVDDVLLNAAKELPLIDEQFTKKLERGSQTAQATDFNGALAGLGVLTVVSSAAFFRRLRPE